MFGSKIQKFYTNPTFPAFPLAIQQKLSIFETIKNRKPLGASNLQRFTKIIL